MNEEQFQSSLSAKAEAAFRQAAVKVIKQAKQTGTPIVVWKAGRVEEIPSDQIEALSGAVDLSDEEPR